MYRSLVQGSTVHLYNCVYHFVCQDGGQYLVAVDEANEHILSLWDWERGQKITETKVKITETKVILLRPINMIKINETNVRLIRQGKITVTKVGLLSPSSYKITKMKVRSFRPM